MHRIVGQGRGGEVARVPTCGHLAHIWTVGEGEGGCKGPGIMSFMCHIVATSQMLREGIEVRGGL